MARPRRDAPQIDWHSLHADWMTGEHTNTALSRKYGVSVARIGKKAKDEGWRMVVGPVDNPVPEADDVDETVELPTVKPQRTSAVMKRAKNLAQRLLSEIENTTTHHDEIAAIIIQSESDPVRRKASLKAISTGDRVRNLKDVVATIKMIDAPPAAAKTPTEKPVGKREQQQQDAIKVATSRFAPRIVSGGK